MQTKLFSVLSHAAEVALFFLVAALLATGMLWMK